MGCERTDPPPRALFLPPPHVPTLFSVPNLSLPVSAKPEMLLAAGSAAHLLAPLHPRGGQTNGAAE